MTAAGPVASGASSPTGELAARVLTAVLLATVHLRSDRRAAARRRSGRGRLALATAVSAAGPVLAVGTVARAQPVRLAAPPSWSDRGLIVSWVLAGVVVEEVIWRAPLLRCRSAPRRAVLAAVSTTGFVLAHLRRDGLASARVHLPNTAGWTTAVLLDGRLRTAVLSHLGYNLVAAALRADATGDHQGPR